MSRFRVSYGDVFEFVGDAGDVVGELRVRHRSPDVSEDRFRRRLAIEMCEWDGGWFYFGDNDSFASSMMAHGMLVELPEVG